MTIEIRELHIRAVVGTDTRRERPGGVRASPKTRDEDRDTLVAQCVERVVEILSQEKER